MAIHSDGFFHNMYRTLISLLLACIFSGLSITGVLIFFDESNGNAILLHVLFATFFLIAAIGHIINNIRSLKAYLRKRKQIAITIGILAITSGALGMGLDHLSFFYAGFKQNQTNTKKSVSLYQLSEDTNLSVELRAGKHFWFPQIAVWTSDTANQYLETLFVTHSTAKGEFYGGRTKENFKTFDQTQRTDFEYRRVDALPYWSKSRGVIAVDGKYAPTRDLPLPDGISGATPDGSMLLNSWTEHNKKFKIWVELNVAFDDNKYYSKYDLPDDTLYHSGTGLLGQPSVVYSVIIDPDLSKKNYILEYAGHTHPSQYKPLKKDTYGLTTSLEILDLGIVSVE